MTTDQVAKHLARQAGECLDGFVIFGFHAGNGEGITLVQARTPKDAAALNKMLTDLICVGGVSVFQPGGAEDGS